jgi:hypothetical protein
VRLRLGQRERPATGWSKWLVVDAAKHGEYANLQRRYFVPKLRWVEMSVRVSPHFGIVIRRKALSRLGIDDRALSSLMEAESPLDSDSDLISFGPHFGEEAANEFIRRLNGAGLEYAEDFFQVPTDVPEWCGVSVFLTEQS